MPGKAKSLISCLIIAAMLMAAAGCGNQTADKTLKVKLFNVSDDKVKKTTKLSLPNSELTGIYSGIDDLYGDADYVVSGTIKKIGYFEVQHILLRKMDILVEKSYKGSIAKNTLISVLENDGYIRLKSLYEDAKKYYEEKNGDKEKEAAWLHSVTYLSDIKDIENDMLIRYTYYDKTDSKIGDKLLLFLTDSSDDTYKDKKVKLAMNKKLSYPEGAFVSLGLWMGKFTLSGDAYTRYQNYFIRQKISDSYSLSEKITGSYTVKEMEDILDKLRLLDSESGSGP